MAERYDVVLDGQLGERRGTLTWMETDGRLTGTFTLFGIDNPVIGRRSGAVLELTHTLRSAVSLLRCCTHAELRGRELCGTITSGRSRIRFRGKNRRKGQRYDLSAKSRLSGALTAEGLL